MPKDKKLTVAVAGATGFVGTALLPKLAEKFRVVALTRGKVRESSDSDIEWRQCDLFSLLETEKALEGVDVAIYLIHSMLPSAELSQGNFQDFDLLVADNFSRAAAQRKIEQIIYLGGMFPQGETLSTHLKSRKEVETALGSGTAALTVFRAAMIMGKEGSSATIVLRLVKRLPLMICPSWTETESQPIDLLDAADSLVAVVGEKNSYTVDYDLAGANSLTYREMMEQSAEVMGLKRYIFGVPVSSLFLSSLWLKLVTGAPRSLSAPLVASLKHRMVAREGKAFKISGKKFLTYQESLTRILKAKSEEVNTPRAFVLPDDERRARTVRSVQRLKLPVGASAGYVAQEYVDWLPKFLSPLLKVEVKDGVINFKLPVLGLSLLQLDYSNERSVDDRQLFYIVGGRLAANSDKDRVEFRETYDKKNILVAVHDFEPALPWYVYKYTQAILHAWIMKKFGQHLRRVTP